MHQQGSRPRLRWAAEVALVISVLIGSGTVSVVAPTTAQAAAKKNVVIVITDDQRFDKVTSTYMPDVSNAFAGDFYSQGIVSNSLCCPSRTSILTGDYSHTTGVWMNHGQHGGFESFGGRYNPTGDDHTVAVDFNEAGYRTAMIGKYLNHYEPQDERYIPPGWDRWFALRTGSYYDYWATVRRHKNKPVRNRHYGRKAEEDYSTNVIRDQALDFIHDAGADPFFLYLSWTAPHGPAIPGPNDVGRFAGDPDYSFLNASKKSSMLDAAYGADRATGRILTALPSNTIVVFLSDNGFLWGEHGLTGKMQPYEEATRVPFAMKSLDGSWSPVAGRDDIVSNVDIRPTLTNAAGIGAPLVPVEGIDLGASDYSPRDEIVLEHGNDTYSYCGVRTNGWMYARFNGTPPDEQLSDSQFLFDLSGDYGENDNLAADPAFADKSAALKAQAVDLCSPQPPGYTW